MRVVVLGACGNVGNEVTRGVIRDGAFDDVVLADVDGPRVRALARELGARAVRVDASDPASLGRALRGAAVLANCTTYRLGVPALRAAIEARVAYLDLGGLYNTPKQLRMDAAARRAGVRAVIGCGATPGLSNVLVRRAADALDEVHEVHISFASHRDLAPSPGLLDTILDEFRPGVARFTWRAGAFVPVRPFEGARTVRFPPPLGPQEVYYVPHSETYTLPRSLGDGLREVAVRGTWRPADMRTLRVLSEIGLTSDHELRVKGSRVRPLDVLRAAMLRSRPAEAGAPWAFWLDVEVVGARGGKPVTVRQQATHPLSWGTDATGRMTALPAVVGVRLLAAGQGRPGVVPPESAFDPDDFVAAVGPLGITVTPATLRRATRPASARAPRPAAVAAG